MARTRGRGRSQLPLALALLCALLPWAAALPVHRRASPLPAPAAYTPAAAPSVVVLADPAHANVHTVVPGPALRPHRRATAGLGQIEVEYTGFTAAARAAFQVGWSIGVYLLN